MQAYYAGSRYDKAAPVNRVEGKSVRYVKAHFTKQVFGALRLRTKQNYFG